MVKGKRVMWDGESKSKERSSERGAGSGGAKREKGR
jgi:hypothetical protein